MMPTVIGAVERQAVFSPNHVDNDAAILAGVAGVLREWGCTVRVYPEQALAAGEVKERCVLSMARSAAALAGLQELERTGAVTVNPAQGVKNCMRERMTTLLAEHGIPHPRSLVFQVDKPPLADMDAAGCFEPCWLKRADFHAIHQEDVCYVRHLDELQGVLGEYARRGVGRVVVNEHLEGDLVKFYGVRGTGFFHWFYPYMLHHSKFQLEDINGEPAGIAFDAGGLEDICRRAANVLGVDVYGGDAIVAADGSMRLIDFNDWPSFAPCRREGAQAIARLVQQKMKEKE